MRLATTMTLRAAGYDVNSVEDLRRAATTEGKNEVRHEALILLAYKAGREAIPTLRQALEDQNPLLRCMAARLMGILGDRSGLDRMRKDMTELTKDHPKESGAKTKPGAPEKGASLYLRSKEGRLICALQAGNVLAEFGDTGGYELAAEAAVQSKVGVIRADAVALLAELGRMDKTTLQAHGCNPEAVLLVVAESETEPFLLEHLHTCAQTNMRPESTVKILEKIKQYPHLSDRGRQIVTSGLQAVRKQLEKENQAAGPRKE
jgi:hypothetical protein